MATCGFWRNIFLTVWAKEKYDLGFDFLFVCFRKVIIEFKDHVNAKVQEFHGDSHTFQGKIPGDIKMAVYRAVKLKQLRIPITIESFK